MGLRGSRGRCSSAEGQAGVQQSPDLCAPRGEVERPRAQFGRGLPGFIYVLKRPVLEATAVVLDESCECVGEERKAVEVETRGGLGFCFEGFGLGGGRCVKDSEFLT